ncbi:hypothetical protein BJ508DRAFT_314649 [Ascobolus immersus RN42]|uniref:Uncharacterized protein n=1 Tax=Ascobolus immersus RN42 TaxID=1160509 RepID=A0A3N4HE97_ASCIM|nr:hypothetical protein BJ508DRAFT_314649 [Ascobolus immersus RN42]
MSSDSEPAAMQHDLSSGLPKSTSPDHVSSLSPSPTSPLMEYIAPNPSHRPDTNYAQVLPTRPRSSSSSTKGSSALTQPTTSLLLSSEPPMQSSQRDRPTPAPNLDIPSFASDQDHHAKEPTSPYTSQNSTSALGLPLTAHNPPTHHHAEQPDRPTENLLVLSGHAVCFAELTKSHSVRRCSWYGEGTIGEAVLSWFREPTAVFEVYDGWYGRLLIVGREGVYDYDDLEIRLRLLGQGETIVSDGDWIEGFNPDNDYDGSEGDYGFDDDEEFPPDFDFSVFCVKRQDD